MVKPREHRIHMYLSDEELQAIEDWRFANRIATRSDAIRRLCQIGVFFDANRAEIVERFGTIARSAAEFTPLLQQAAANASELSDLERSLAKVGSRTLNDVLSAVLVIRTTTGIANNFKGERAVKDIITEAKEIFAIGEDSDTE
ncbi:hypothetical protein GHK46_27150 [Sinorhizobium medicae]|uniref:hypothetical protein n=1 Tax=Sinorhizobium medicae TaxID=110321 RepID=UPI001295F175|nr:hypothetical protein [Sinorhizobium medicae]MQW00862.1 hypothetical protein [Sinorhizobium medicae]